MENVNEIKQVVNQLSIQLTIVSAKCSVLEDMLLGLVMDKMPDQYPEIYTKYVDELEQVATGQMNHLEDILLDSGDKGLASRERFNLLEMLQAMKRNSSYMSDTDKASSNLR